MSGAKTGPSAGEANGANARLTLRPGEDGDEAADAADAGVREATGSDASSRGLGDRPFESDDTAPETMRPLGVTAPAPPVSPGEPEFVPTEPQLRVSPALSPSDIETTVNLTGDIAFSFVRDDSRRDGDDDVIEGPFTDEQTMRHAGPRPVDANDRDLSAAEKTRIKGLLEALVFVSDRPIKATELAKSAGAPLRIVKELLTAIQDDFAPRGIQLGELAGGYLFRTNPAYAHHVRDLSKQKAVKLTRAQIESLSILAYRQPITRPEIDEIRGVDSGPVLKLLLERDLIRILGKKDEPGRPLLYGTTHAFLEYFGLKTLRDLPTLREFTELNEDSRRLVEKELGEVLDEKQEASLADAGALPGVDRSLEDATTHHDTVRPTTSADEWPGHRSDIEDTVSEVGPLGPSHGRDRRGRDDEEREDTEFNRNAPDGFDPDADANK